jgi:NADPH:quinone reductase-like Zn-dependent oxidoreductase
MSERRRPEGIAVVLVVLKQLIEAGKVRSVIDQTYPLNKAAEAIGYLEKGHARGKGRHHHLSRAVIQTVP